jgi:hypothetical protein
MFPKIGRGVTLEYRHPPMNFSFSVPFTMLTVQDWVDVFELGYIYMSDMQYAHYAALRGSNKTDFKGIPSASWTPQRPYDRLPSGGNLRSRPTRRLHRRRHHSRLSRSICAVSMQILDRHSEGQSHGVTCRGMPGLDGVARTAHPSAFSTYPHCAHQRLQSRAGR